MRSLVEVPRTMVDAQELLEVDVELQHLFNLAFDFIKSIKYKKPLKTL